MIEILEAPRHTAAFKFSGSISAADVEKAAEAIDAALKDNAKISVFMEIDPTMELTLEGVIKDLSDALGRLGQLRRFHRTAIVTDKTWLGSMARLEGLVLWFQDIRVFTPADREKAFAWATEPPPGEPRPEVAGPAVRFIQTTSERVFAFEVNGTVREADVNAVVDHICPFMELQGKFSILARMQGFSGFDLSAVLSGDYLSMKMKALGKVEKYAVVGVGPWLRNLVELAGPVTGIEVRVFDEQDEDQAWQWIGATQALLADVSMGQ